jgi:hypothetical protein
MAASGFEILLAELAFALKPVVDATQADPPGSGLQRLALETGYDLEGLLTEERAGAFAEAVSSLHGAIATIVADPAGFASRIPELLDNVGSLGQELDGLDNLLPPGSDLGTRLFDYLLTTYLEQRVPTLYALLRLTGVVRQSTVPAAGTVPEHQRREIVWGQFGRLTEPERVFAELYGWGDVDLDSNTLLARLSDVLWALGLPATFEGASAPGTDGALTLSWMLAAGPVNLLFQLRAGHLPAEGQQPPGIGVVPSGVASFEHELTLAGGWRMTIAVRAGATAGFGLSVRPRGDVALGPVPGQPPVDWTLGGDLTLERSTPPGQRLVLFGAPAATRLEAEAAAFTARVDAGPAGGDVGVELGVRGGNVVITLEGADNFLQRVLPAGGLSVAFDFTVGWSNRHGLHFAGAGALETTLAVQLNLGPLRLDSIYLALRALPDGRIEVEAAASVTLNLAVLTAAVDRIGLRATLDTQPPFALEFAFKPPTGAALSVDAGPVTGGGFLFFDPDAEQYAGGVHLEVQGMQLTAIGLLTTRMPDGSRGFSLLVIITASGFTPIQLGYGFTLNGVGGLVGINRTMALEVLRAGVRERALDSILFSRDDPIPRAAQIVSTLRAVFPPAPNRFVFGPMAIIGWGSPTILTIELAVLLELPAPIRLVLLGRLRALLPGPEEDTAVVRLNLDVLGIIDFGRRELSLDATLYDSTIAKFAISGDMALRASWGEQPGFALSAGGFHPRFQPPPGFPALRRLAISLSTEESPRLRLESYLAVTSNTVQIGARLDVYVEAGGFALVGMISFDGLVQFNPFLLDLELAGAFALKRDSRTLMGVDIRIRLTGPAPWHARGEATFQFLIFR